MAVSESRVAGDASHQEMTQRLMSVKDDAQLAGSEKPSEGTQALEDDAETAHDGSWGWMVALGVFVNYVLVLGYIRSTGLIFVELLEKFKVSPSTVALLFAIQNGVYSIGGFFVMNVVLGRVGARRVVFLGGLLLAFSAILSSFAKQLALLICLQSVLLGLSHSMVISPGQVLVGRYLKKRRNLALGFTECGVSIGNIVVPLLMSRFLQEYALEGTLLLYGGLCLNSLPAALLHRPFTAKHRGQKTTHLNSAAKDHDTAAGDSDGSHGGFTHAAKDFEGGSPSESFVHSEDQQCVAEPLCAGTQSFPQSSVRENGQATADVGKDALLGNGNCSQAAESGSQSCCGQRFTSFSSMLNLSLFNDGVFYVFVIHAIFSGFASVPADYLPDLVRQHDLTESQAATLLSVIGVLDLVCRVTCGVMSNSKRVRVTTLIIVSYVALGVVLQFVRYMRTFQHFLVLAVIQGLLSSVGYCLFPHLVIELIGLDRMAGAIGWNQLACGIFMAPMYPLLSYIQDVTGSYVLVYHLTGVALMICGGVLCLVRPVNHFQHRNQLESSAYI